MPVPPAMAQLLQKFWSLFATQMSNYLVGIYMELGLSSPVFPLQKVQYLISGAKDVFLFT